MMPEYHSEMRQEHLVPALNRIPRHYRSLAFTVLIGLLLVVVLSDPAAAAKGKGIAKSICNSSGYKLLLGVVWAIMGLSIVGLVMSGIVGSVLKSLGWLGQAISELGNKAIVNTIIGGIMLLIILTILGLVVAKLTIGIPTTCLLPV